MPPKFVMKQSRNNSTAPINRRPEAKKRDSRNPVAQNHRRSITLIFERDVQAEIRRPLMNPDWNVHLSLMRAINARYIVRLFDGKGRSARNRTCLHACVFTFMCRRIDVCETNRNARSFGNRGWWNDLPRANAISIPGLMSPLSTFVPSRTLLCRTSHAKKDTLPLFLTFCSLRLMQVSKLLLLLSTEIFATWLAIILSHKHISFRRRSVKFFGIILFYIFKNGGFCINFWLVKLC